MDFKTFSSPKKHRFTLTKIDEDMNYRADNAITTHDSQASSSIQRGEEPAPGRDFTMDTELNSDDDEKHSSEKTNVIQTAMTVLLNLDEFLQGNGSEHHEYGVLSSDVQELRKKLKNHIASCSAETQTMSSDGSSSINVNVS